jgi:hypothetical protein
VGVSELEFVAAAVSMSDFIVRMSMNGVFGGGAIWEMVRDCCGKGANLVWAFNFLEMGIVNKN